MAQSIKRAFAEFWCKESPFVFPELSLRTTDAHKIVASISHIFNSFSLTCSFHLRNILQCQNNFII
jgi:hypothetical protein